MAQLNVMYWNVGGLDQGRLGKAGPSYAALIASVMRAGDVGVAGFGGVLAGQGGLLGQQLVNELGQSAWKQQPSPLLGKGRDEQYLFLWNSGAVTPYSPPGQDYCLWEYPVPGWQWPSLGFPRPQNESPDLPPFTMFFMLGTSGKWLPMAIMHAPEWELGRANGQGIGLALESVAQIGALDLGNGSLLMGTFNVPADDNVGTNGSNGALVFGGLAGPAGKYDKALTNQLTVLGEPIVANSAEEGYVQPSDNFFLRRNSARGGVTGSAPGVLNVIEASLGSLNGQGEWQRAPLPQFLSDVEAASTTSPATAGPDGSYDRFDDAFASYCLYVSDHLPISMTINF
jgi:hypothetical protein